VLLCGFIVTPNNGTSRRFGQCDNWRPQETALAVRFPLCPARGPVQELPVVYEPENLDVTVEGDAVEHEVVRIANTVLLGHEAPPHRRR
jgi:hypothetical protein